MEVVSSVARDRQQGRLEDAIVLDRQEQVRSEPPCLLQKLGIARVRGREDVESGPAGSGEDGGDILALGAVGGAAEDADDIEAGCEELGQTEGADVAVGQVEQARMVQIALLNASPTRCWSSSVI